MTCIVPDCDKPARRQRRFCQLHGNRPHLRGTQAIPPLIRKQPRFPYAPLTKFGDQSSLSILLGVPRRTIHRWAHDDIPANNADVVAVKLGFHPCELWPEEWWEVSA